VIKSESVFLKKLLVKPAQANLWKQQYDVVDALRRKEQEFDELTRRKPDRARTVSLLQTGNLEEAQADGG
jgi:hypothetical protein